MYIYYIDTGPYIDTSVDQHDLRWLHWVSETSVNRFLAGPVSGLPPNVLYVLYTTVHVCKCAREQPKRADPIVRVFNVP